MHDQADQLRKLVRHAVQADGALAPGGLVVAVGAGQPGAGATTVAALLATELARLGKQVAVVDANLQRPAASLPQRLGAAGDRAAALRGNLRDVLAGSRRVVEVLTPIADGVRLLAGCPAGQRAPLSGESIERFVAELAALSRQTDAIVLDVGSGMNLWIDRLWRFARQVLLVAPPTPAGLVDCYSAVKLSQFHRLDGKLRLAVNRCEAGYDAAPLAERFAATCQRFLFVTPGAPAPLPLGGERHEPDALERAVRLLAADLAGEFRATSLRMLRPSAAGRGAAVRDDAALGRIASGDG
jgi:flagellar biosynthesis protein FlhG